MLQIVLDTHFEYPTLLNYLDMFFLRFVVFKLFIIIIYNPISVLSLIWLNQAGNL